MATDPTDDRGRKAALNQSLFREVNERVLQVVDGAAIHPFICECAHADCARNVSMSTEEYEAVRRFPTHFVVKPGHERTDVERVVHHANGRFVVVEKIGVAGAVAVELDPRRRSRPAS